MGQQIPPATPAAAGLCYKAVSAPESAHAPQRQKVKKKEETS